jgi:hypothetical protein
MAVQESCVDALIDKVQDPMDDEGHGASNGSPISLSMVF